MKSAGWYFMMGGRKVFAATVTEIRKLAQLAADEMGAPVTVRRHTAAPARKVTAKRNPAIRGVDFTGEEWTVAGLGKRGRLEMLEGSREDAQRAADYLHREGYRALTIRRTKAPVAKPTRGARRLTNDTRPPVVGKGRRRR